MPAISVIIATRNRAEPLRTTLATLRDQTLAPSEVLIVDSSDTAETRELIENLLPETPFPLRYMSSKVRSAAVQRNMGAEAASSEFLAFIDDDVRLSGDFLMELARPFSEDADGRLAGVSGTIVNQIYTQPKGINRLLLACCLGNFDDCWAGRLVGPAVNFLPQDITGRIQTVDWLFSTGTAYRKCIFDKYRFGSQFRGYSFAEDVHLSARIGRKYRLLNTTFARFEHMDMGHSTHTDWVALGESMVTNRWAIMTEVLGMKRFRDLVRLFAYEVLYCTLAMLAQSRFRPGHLAQTGRLLWGKLRAFCGMRLRKSAA